MCYSYRDRQMEEEARRRLWEVRKRRKKKGKSERPAEKKDRELVRA